VSAGGAGELRPNLAARQRHIERYGPEGADDFPVAPAPAIWRRENVLVEARRELDGPVIDLFDLFDADTRQELEDRHAALLVEYGLEHLDLSEITTKRRPVTDDCR
jgi:hypothetical protein